MNTHPFITKSASKYLAITAPRDLQKPLLSQRQAWQLHGCTRARWLPSCKAAWAAETGGHAGRSAWT
eukprot:4003143-Lingulodinium_polyedra.AAC.1